MVPGNANSVDRFFNVNFGSLRFAFAVPTRYPGYKKQKDQRMKYPHHVSIKFSCKRKRCNQALPPKNNYLVRVVLQQVLVVIHFYLWNRQSMMPLQYEIIEINIPCLQLIN